MMMSPATPENTDHGSFVRSTAGSALLKQDRRLPFRDWTHARRAHRQRAKGVSGEHQGRACVCVCRCVEGVSLE